MTIKCPECNSENTDNSLFCSDCGIKLSPPEKTPLSQIKTLEIPIHSLQIGSLFAERYEILEKLGKGGMGEVYKVSDKKLDEDIALKLINPEITSDVNTIKRFRNELKLAIKITHKNVCRMHDLHEEAGTPFITMEYIEGEDLKSLISKKEKFSEEELILIAKQICEGFKEAHALGVIHRDLKPQNIMIDKTGTAKIMDFGIARSVDAPGITQTGMMIGSPYYISPEQADEVMVDQRSDIYSFGVILFEMVTGRVPFEGDTSLSIVIKHKTEAPKDPKELNANISDDLSHLILKCLEKDKEKRYQNAEQVISEINAIEESLAAGIKGTRRKSLRAEGKKIIEIRSFKWKKAFIYVFTPVLLLLLIIGAYFIFTGPKNTVESIAVLPLYNLSGNPEREFFADGMTDALIAELGKIQMLRVISYTSIMQYKGVRKALPEIAKDLNVEVLVEGSVFQAENRIRITVQLIQAKPEQHLWAENYEREYKDILTLQREVAKAIANEIKVKMTPQEQVRLSKAREVNPEAFEAYLKGRFYLSKRTGDNFLNAVDQFQHAIKLDSNYALAYSGLADSYILMSSYQMIPSSEAKVKAREMAMKARDLDDTLAEVHVSLAAIFTMEFDWKKAEEEFLKAIELNPNYATAHHWYAGILQMHGRMEEAIKEIKLAHEIDPLSLRISVDLGRVFYFDRQYDKAIRQYQHTLELDPKFAPAHSLLGLSYLQKGQYEQAIAEIQEGITLRGGGLSSWLGYAYAVAGENEKALDYLEKWKERLMLRGMGADVVANINVGLGNKELALEWLVKAYETDPRSINMIKVFPFWDPLREDPRFIDLLEKLGLNE